jgi:hypothetical protein
MAHPDDGRSPRLDGFRAHRVADHVAIALKRDDSRGGQRSRTTAELRLGTVAARLVGRRTSGGIEPALVQVRHVRADLEKAIAQFLDGLFSDATPERGSEAPI